MVIFLCNAGPNIGFGHLVRCTALAKELHANNHKLIMIGPSKKYRTRNNKSIFFKWQEISEWKSSDYVANLIIKNVSNNLTDIVVLDDYRIDETFQLKLKSEKIKWLQFNIKIDCNFWGNWILNTCPSVDAKAYKGKIKNKTAKLLLGQEYAILRSEFSKIKKTHHSKKVNNILLTFGGGNDHGATLLVLNSIFGDLMSEMKYSIVSGKNNPQNKNIKKFIRKHSKGEIDFYIDPQDIFDIFINCDFAIVAGGTTTFELLKCEIPMAIIAIADNQVEQAKSLEQLGVAEYLGDISNINGENIKKGVIEIISEKHYRKMKQCILKIQKPMGRELISELLMKNL